MTTRIRLYTTTMRSIPVLSALRAAAPHEEIDVVTAIPSPLEPDYLDLLSRIASLRSARLHIAKRPDVLIHSLLHPADLILCTNWRHKLSQVTCESASLGAYIIHDSLLPKYRGFSPLVHAIRNGETVTGATMFVATDEIDAGPVVKQERVAIGPDDRIRDVLPSMAAAYCRIIEFAIPQIIAGRTLPTTSQREEDSSYCPQIDWEREAEINPEWDDEKVRNHIRAFSPPYPRAFIMVGERKVYVS